MKIMLAFRRMNMCFVCIMLWFVCDCGLLEVLSLLVTSPGDDIQNSMLFHTNVQQVKEKIKLKKEDKVFSLWPVLGRPTNDVHIDDTAISANIGIFTFQQAKFMTCWILFNTSAAS